MSDTQGRARMLGVRDGLIYAIVTVGNLRATITGPAGAYLPPLSHVRKRAAVERRLAELDRVSDALKRHLESVKAVLSDWPHVTESAESEHDAGDVSKGE